MPGQTAPQDVSEDEARPLSLRRNFSWTFAGNALYAASQWAVLSLIAKLGTAEMLGEYALAVAVAMPVSMLAHLNLRAALATDVVRRHPFGDYLAVRFGVSALGLAAIAAVALLSGYSGAIVATVALVGLSLMVEHISDIYYAPMQRRERMDQIARSMIARGAVSVLAMGVALWMTRNLLVGVAGLALARALVLLVYDRPRGAAGEDLSRTTFRAQAGIFRTALPLGVVLMLVSLTANLPRYAIERHLGMRDLGAYAAVASFITVGSTMINALGQSATPRLARQFSSGDKAGFRRLTMQVAAVAAALGVCGVLVAAVFGKLALRLVYRPEYAAYSWLLVAVMAAAIGMYLGIALGYAVTSARAFGPQMPLLCAVAAAAGVSSWLLVPVMGLGGAAAALAIASAVQIAGQLLILRRAVRTLESAA